MRAAELKEAAQGSGPRPPRTDDIALESVPIAAARRKNEGAAAPKQRAGSTDAKQGTRKPTHLPLAAMSSFPGEPPSYKRKADSARVSSAEDKGDEAGAATFGARGQNKERSQAKRHRKAAQETVDGSKCSTPAPFTNRTVTVTRLTVPAKSAGKSSAAVAFEGVGCYWFDGDLMLGEAQDAPAARCHGCPKQDAMRTCQKEGCNKSYCQTCLRPYLYLLNAHPEHSVLHGAKEEFCKGVCPCCLAICVTSRCIRRHAEKRGAMPPPQLSSAQEMVAAAHVIGRVSHGVQRILDLSEEEVRSTLAAPCVSFLLLRVQMYSKIMPKECRIQSFSFLIAGP